MLLVWLIDMQICLLDKESKRRNNPTHLKYLWFWTSNFQTSMNLFLYLSPKILLWQNLPVQLDWIGINLLPVNISASMANPISWWLENTLNIVPKWSLITPPIPIYMANLISTWLITYLELSSLKLSIKECKKGYKSD